ncbi:fused MFS/spermidine synthase [Sulfurimonas sp.]|uniref:fused MFS/spermidine synthase n=1 Tax=Sulfurimonas sp. TaxID=2022749 RepID=UPI001A0CD834|nr:fused MFS/spermidine synthase [Sulfurimonas sp.]MBE0514622.1 fused MFS/spermidine synthase [Sulfurimonas sp.]
MKQFRQLSIEDSSKASLSMVDWTLSIFLLLSGASALIYQVLWVRLLTLSIGSTSVSISIVLSVFFLGLGVGSYFAASLIKKFKNPLKVYIVVEAGIALSAILILPLLLNLDYFISLLPIVEAGVWIKFFVVTAILFIPTFLIGTTFPLIVAVAVHNKKEVGQKLAHFYAFNSLGAVAGAISSGFYLIPNFALDGTLYVAVMLNISIAVAGVALLGHFNSSFKVQQRLFSNTAKTNKNALFVLFITGFTALATEVGWMKFLIVYTGNTIYGFSMILAMFIAGITIGSFIAKLKIISKIETEKLLFFGLILLALALLGARAGLGAFPEIYEQLNTLEVGAFAYRWSKYFVMFLILLPATAMFGLLFPLALQYYSPNIDTLHANVGKAYSVNIIAGIMGSIVAGFWIIPYFSTDVLLSAAAFIVLLSSFIFIKSNAVKNAFLYFVGFFSVAFAMNFFLPHLDYRKMVEIVISRDSKAYSQKSTIHYIKEGESGVIGLLSNDDNPCIVKIFNNGLNESWIDVCNSENMLLSEFLLGKIPLMLNPDAKKAFVVGYGGGTTLMGLSMSELESINVVEIEPAVLDAVRTLYNNRLPTDNDKRVNITINDARYSLLISKGTYDIIVSQPSHPWLRGSSNIMNRDFFEIVKSKLSQNGINGQWVPLFMIDIATLKSIIKAYTDTFTYVVSFVNVNTRDFLMFGSNMPININREFVLKEINHSEARAVFTYHNIDEPEDLMGYFALSKEQLVEISANSEPATDLNLLSEIYKSRYGAIDGNSFNTLGFINDYLNSQVVK